MTKRRLNSINKVLGNLFANFPSRMVTGPGFLEYVIDLERADGSTLQIESFFEEPDYSIKLIGPDPDNIYRHYSVYEDRISLYTDHPASSHYDDLSESQYQELINDLSKFAWRL